MIERGEVKASTSPIASGLVDIDVHAVELSELERQIAECDENLCASNLTPSEKALFTARRKEAYEALHLEASYDARPGRAGKSRQVGDNSDAAHRFTVHTASKTGESERTVQRNTERGDWRARPK